MLNVKFKGDKGILVVVILLSLISFLPIYSSSSNLAYTHANGNTIAFLLKHFVHLSFGFAIMFFVYRLPSKFRAYSKIGLVFSLVLLLWAMMSGGTISGANASRWVRIAGQSFQPSAMASVFLMMYVASYLAKQQGIYIRFGKTILPLLLPVLGVLGLVFPANFSTAAIIFVMVMMLMFVGSYPIKYLFMIVSFIIILAVSFYGLIKVVPNIFPNRVSTWESRIESFMTSSSGQEAYQVEKAKMAIAVGGITGKGPGKSMQKNFLPQSSSDFIFAIIVEEYGSVSTIILITLYLYFLLRVVVIMNKSKHTFSKLLVFGMGVPIVFNAFINMAVAVNLFPVTGQTLPFISSGGTSIWMNCMAVGVILNVSRNHKLKEETL